MKWAMVSLCIGHDEFTCWDEDQKLVLFDSEEEVYRDIAEDMIVELQQFLDGERDFNHTDFECQYSAVKVEEVIDENTGHLCYGAHDSDIPLWDTVTKEYIY